MKFFKTESHPVSAIKELFLNPSQQSPSQAELSGEYPFFIRDLVHPFSFIRSNQSGRL